MKNFSKGFTLIELLVVIAIVGLLSSVVLASLQSARDKAVDAKIKESLTQLRNDAEVLLDKHAGGGVSGVGYAGLFECPSYFNDNCSAYEIYNSALTATGVCGETPCGEAVSNDETALSDEYFWAAWVYLKTDRTQAWCVDYTGFSGPKVVPSGGGSFISTQCSDIM